MNILEAFKLEQWDAKEEFIGQHAVLTFNVVTPREAVKCVVWAPDEKHIFHMSASNSFNHELAELILDHCKGIDPSSLPVGKVKVVPTNFGSTSKFETVVVAPPEIDLFGHLAQELRSKLYLVSPAFKSEFRDGISAKDWRHQIGRKDGWRVYVYKWDRPEKTAPSWN